MLDSSATDVPALDLTRRARVHFRQDKNAGPVQVSSTTLLEGWHFEEEWHQVAVRQDTRNIILSFQDLGSRRIELTVLSAHYRQERFPRFYEEDRETLAQGLWQDKTLDQLWHEEDAWQTMLFHQMLVLEQDSYLMDFSHPMSHPVLMDVLPITSAETLTFLEGLRVVRRYPVRQWLCLEI